MDEIKRFVGKKIFVILNSNRKYSGVIKSVSEDGFVFLLDKFDQEIMFKVSDINLIEEERI
jgi:small nuclear ribonucleoprotein (snRNP)-like protein